jgi:hypothetical protein
MGSRPICDVKIGAVRGACWENVGKNGNTFFSVKLTRLYKDKNDDKWKDSSSFSLRDLPLVAKVADQLHTVLYRKKSKARSQEVDDTNE